MNTPGETLNSESQDQNGWSDFPAFQGNLVGEKIENAPDYLSDIDPDRRKEIVDTSAEMTRDIPGAIVCGGNANRILYEVYTGKTMFGVGKNDSDIYVPHANLEELLAEQPEGYGLKHELTEDGKEKWVRPEEDYIVLTHSGEHIDVFGTGDLHESTIVELDGKPIRVQSLTDQINDKIRLMYETEGLTKIGVDPVHNPDPVSKYGVYAQRILEMADSEKGRAELTGHADKLPENWRETMEVMASQGKYGDQLDPERRKVFQEKMGEWKKTQETMKQIQDQMVSELKAYYEKRSDTLPSFVGGFEGKINEALGEASNSDEFIQAVMNKMTAEDKKAVKDRIKALAMGNDAQKESIPTHNESFEAVKGNFQKNYDAKVEQLKGLKEQLTNTEEGNDRMAAFLANRVNSLAGTIDSIGDNLKRMRPNNEEDLRRRSEIRVNFSKAVNEAIPDGEPVVFHGVDNIEVVKKIIESGGLKTPEERGADFKSFATQIDVTAKKNIQTTCNFADAGVNSFLPYGGIFVFYPKEHEKENVLSTGDGTEVFGGVEGVNLKEDRFMGLITTDENIDEVKALFRANGLEEGKVFTHDQFLEYCKKKYKSATLPI